MKHDFEPLDELDGRSFRADDAKIVIDSKTSLTLACLLTACGESADVGGGEPSTATGNGTSTSGATVTTASGTSTGTTSSGTSNGNGGTTSATTSGATTGDGSGAVPSAPCMGGSQSCDARVVASDAEYPAAFSMVPPYLYWREPSRLRRLRVDPLGEPETLVEDDGTTSLAADADHIYYTSGNDIHRAPASGGQSELLVQTAATLYDIEVDATNIFFTDFQALYSVPKQGGTPSVLLVATTATVELHGDHAYVAVTNLMLDGDTISGVVRVPRAGGDPEVIFQGDEPPVVLHPTDQGLAVATTSQVLYQPLGGTAQPLLDCSPQCGSLVVDGDVVYVTDNTGLLESSDYPANVYSVPLGGGMPTLIGSTAASLLSIKYYGDRLYFSQFAEAGSGAILSLGKCPCE